MTYQSQNSATLLLAEPAAAPRAAFKPTPSFCSNRGLYLHQPTMRVAQMQKMALNIDPAKHENDLQTLHI